MAMALIVAWCALSIPLALLFGATVRLRERRSPYLRRPRRPRIGPVRLYAVPTTAGATRMATRR